MKFLYSDEPIIACSTGTHAHAAMAVIRISGFKDLSQFKPFFGLNLGPIEPRRVYYTNLVLQGQKIDDICLTYFKGPKSYNGENTLELSVHGNTLNVERIIDLFIKEAGCRAAAPGEFTYRALKNKKLTLSQVEGLDLFLNANSGYALDQGLSLLSGNLQETYQEIYDLFLKHKASLELSIDFSEDVGEEAAQEHFNQSLNELKTKFDALERKVLPLDQNLIRPEIILAGLPNSGKSSLFNFLLREERAIVSAVAGTTRDYLSELLSIEGVKYKLVDTAGLRDSADKIEAEGVKRSRKKINEAFFSILLINPFEIVDGFSALMNQNFDQIYFTHADQAGFSEAKNELVKLYPKLGSIGAINVKKLDESWELGLFTGINNKYLAATNKQPILLDRHKLLILQASKTLQEYKKLANYERDVAILSGEINTLGHCISELIGIVSPDQVLNSIFSNFCIGK